MIYKGYHWERVLLLLDAFIWHMALWAGVSLYLAGVKHQNATIAASCPLPSSIPPSPRDLLLMIHSVL